MCTVALALAGVSAVGSGVADRQAKMAQWRAQKNAVDRSNAQAKLQYQNEIQISAYKDQRKSKEFEAALDAQVSARAALNKQLEMIKIQNVIKDKNKNKIKDKEIGDFKVREQVLSDFPPKELRSVIDQGKKDIKKGIIISISTLDDKVGVAVGVGVDVGHIATVMYAVVHHGYIFALI